MARDAISQTEAEDTIYISERTLEKHNGEFFIIGFYNPKILDNTIEVKGTPIKNGKYEPFSKYVKMKKIKI